MLRVARKEAPCKRALIASADSNPRCDADKLHEFFNDVLTGFEDYVLGRN